MKHSFLLLLVWQTTWALTAPATGTPPKPPKTTAYRFACCPDNAKREETIRFALGPGGYHYTALTGNRPGLSPAAARAPSSSTTATRPHSAAAGSSRLLTAVFRRCGWQKTAWVACQYGTKMNGIGV